ncbi:hypothetical protein [Legionella birminghamensis]|uniref:hypothetical protein n=1 Tax=Legionella birminghamensis TaxID=28083 RepID=UPI001ED995DF|nr:hypothetical protein [Legionella birminghamensis]
MSNKIINIGTLGPTGTSSEAATIYFTRTFRFRQKQVDQFAIILLNSFKCVLRELVHGDLTLAIVPHAYSKINLFYINPKIALYGIFIHDTPPYGLARREDTIPSGQYCRIVSHPAPAHLLDSLVDEMGLSGYEIEYVESTSKAALEVFERKADLALTNRNAMNKYGLVCCAPYGAIRMGWSVFIKKEVKA